MDKKQIRLLNHRISSHAVVFAVFLKLPPILTLIVRWMGAEKMEVLR